MNTVSGLPSELRLLRAFWVLGALFLWNKFWHLSVLLQYCSHLCGGGTPSPPGNGNLTFSEGLWWNHKVCSPNSISFWSISEAAQSCPTLCDPMDCSTPGLPVYHQLPELTQTHVHQVGDAIQPSHPLSSPSPPAPNPSQHQLVGNGPRGGKRVRHD